MRILLIMDPGIPVPPVTYGGHERLVYMFAEAYSKLGHEVTLLSGPDSKITGKIYPFGRNELKRSKLQKLKELFFVWRFLSRKKTAFDLIHNFGRLAYLLPVINDTVKKIMTYGRPVSAKGIKLIHSFPNKNLIFTACSDYCVSTGYVAGRWKTIYNAINFSKYNLNTTVEPDAPLMFLGRLDQVKGLNTAIEVAKATHHKLWIGGNIPNTEDNYAYFKEILEPQFDGKQIIYLGALNDEEKNKYLGKSKALLFPIAWDEPFGMVMIEAMACGTPVIAFNRGSVKEIVIEAVNGFAVTDKEQMIEALNNINKIDRAYCRAHAAKRFDVKIIADQYLALFDQE